MSVKSASVVLAAVLSLATMNSGVSQIKNISQSLLKDVGFKSAFTATINGTDGVKLGTDESSGYWEYDQNNSLYHLSPSNYYIDGTTKVYYASEEKKLFIDSAGESVYLYADSSYDYTPARTERQPIAANVLRQSIKNHIPLEKVSDLTLTTDFFIAEYVDLNGTAYDADIHTAQLQISLMVQNLNPDSLGYGDYYLFVLPLYDARYTQSPSYDNGSNDGSGKKYVRNLSSRDFLTDSVVVPFTAYSVNLNITEWIYDIFLEAKTKNYLSKCNWSDMYISTFSIIQSLPGSYKIGCYFSNVGLKYNISLQNAYLDEDYQSGFDVYTTEEGNGTVCGALKKDEGGTAPVWTIAQWNSVNNIVNGYRIIRDDLYLWGDNSKQVFIRPESNTLGLLLNASAEYSADRTANQPWPCLLLNQEFDFEHHIKVNELASLFMNINFRITKMENHMNGSVNPSLHAAQLLWYITVQNRNVNSPDFGKYVWFGLQLYDSRYTFSPFYANEDGGKDVNTGMFIYLPEATDFLEKEAVVGSSVSVEYNALSRIKQAFSLAQSRGYLTNTVFEDLYIGGMNVGWELPGTYDVCVEIDDINLYPVY